MKKRIAIVLFCFIFLRFIGINKNLSSQVLEQDSLALVALYDSTNGTNWTNNTNWLTGPVSAWYGIYVSGDRVSSLSLDQNSLAGIIPPEIGNLTNLKVLNFNRNQLSGSIPAEIGNLVNLTGLYLYGNEFSGSIPTEIGNLTNLEGLNLAFNQLSGSIPSEIGNLTNMRVLSIHFNQLSGSFPPEIGNLTAVVQIYADNNQLSGSIPPEIGNLANLTTLWLDNNQFSGFIPTEISNLINLEYFYLHDNKLIDLPDLSADTALTDLKIQNNKFTFEDIEPNIGVPNFIYSPQDSVGEEQDTTIDQGSSLELSVTVGGKANQYQWMKDGVDIPGANISSYTISSVDSSDSGFYICRITNTIATELTLYSRPIHVIVEGAVSVSDHATQIPKAFALYQNYPNPFNPTTNIKYQLPERAQIFLGVYNVLGQLVRTLIDEKQMARKYSVRWDGKDYKGRFVSSGLYFYTIRTKDFVKSRKMILIR